MDSPLPPQQMLKRGEGEEKATARRGEAEGGPESKSSYGVHPDGRPVGQYDYLNNFFKKYNKVMLDVASVRRERERLHEEVRKSARIAHIIADHSFSCIKGPVHCPLPSRRLDGWLSLPRALLPSPLSPLPPLALSAVPPRLFATPACQSILIPLGLAASLQNEELRRILKHYLEGISVSEGVLQNPVNPLLVVNERLQKALQVRGIEGDGSDESERLCVRRRASSGCEPQALRRARAAKCCMEDMRWLFVLCPMTCHARVTHSAGPGTACVLGVVSRGAL